MRVDRLAVVLGSGCHRWPAAVREGRGRRKYRMVSRGTSIGHAFCLTVEARARLQLARMDPPLTFNNLLSVGADTDGGAQLSITFVIDELSKEFGERRNTYQNIRNWINRGEALIPTAYCYPYRQWLGKVIQVLGIRLQIPKNLKSVLEEIDNNGPIMATFAPTSTFPHKIVDYYDDDEDNDDDDEDSDDDEETESDDDADYEFDEEEILSQQLGVAAMVIGYTENKFICHMNQGVSDFKAGGFCQLQCGAVQETQEWSSHPLSSASRFRSPEALQKSRDGVFPGNEGELDEAAKLALKFYNRTNHFCLLFVLFFLNP